MHSNRLYIDIAKSKSSASFIVVPLIFVIQLPNGAQFLNANKVETLRP